MHGEFHHIFSAMNTRYDNNFSPRDSIELSNGWKFNFPSDFIDDGYFTSYLRNIVSSLVFPPPLDAVISHKLISINDSQLWRNKKILICTRPPTVSG